MSSTIPRWDMSNVFPSLDSHEFEAALSHYAQEIAEIGELFSDRIAAAGSQASVTVFSDLLAEAVPVRVRPAEPRLP